MFDKIINYIYILLELTTIVLILTFPTHSRISLVILLLIIFLFHVIVIRSKIILYILLIVSILVALFSIYYFRDGWPSPQQDIFGFRYFNAQNAILSIFFTVVFSRKLWLLRSKMIKQNNIAPKPLVE